VFDLHDHSELTALLSDSEDFGRNGGHKCHFLRLASPETNPPSKPQVLNPSAEERTFDIVAYFGLEVEFFLQCVEAAFY
jgi:hypothetical protein